MMSRYDANNHVTMCCTFNEPETHRWSQLR